jgi:uncharacterized membrane protein YkgB
MNFLIKTLLSLGIGKKDLDYNVIRAVMVIIYAWFGYDKWFESEIKGLVPLISHGPLISWMLPVFGIRGTGYFLASSEWTFGTLIFLGFWNKKLGIVGALGACGNFICTLTIFPFAPDAWDAGAGGFPAMTIVTAFLLKDLVILAASFYLLRQDVLRVAGREMLPINASLADSGGVSRGFAK